MSRHKHYSWFGEKKRKKICPNIFFGVVFIVCPFDLIMADCCGYLVTTSWCCQFDHFIFISVFYCVSRYGCDNENVTKIIFTFLRVVFFCGFLGKQSRLNDKRLNSTLLSPKFSSVGSLQLRNDLDSRKWTTGFFFWRHSQSFWVKKKRRMKWSPWASSLRVVTSTSLDRKRKYHNKTDSIEYRPLDLRCLHTNI